MQSRSLPCVACRKERELRQARGWRRQTGGLCCPVAQFVPMRGVVISLSLLSDSKHLKRDQRSSSPAPERDSVSSSFVLIASSGREAQTLGQYRFHCHPLSPTICFASCHKCFVQHIPILSIKILAPPPSTMTRSNVLVQYSLRFPSTLPPPIVPAWHSSSSRLCLPLPPVSHPRLRLCRPPTQLI